MNKRLVKGVVVIVVGYGMAFAPANANAFSFQSVVMWLRTMQSEMSAWSVTVKQTALSANQSAASRHASNRELATAIGAISMSDRITKAVMSVDGTFGQPVTIKCAAQKDATLQVEARQQMSHDRMKLIGTFAATRVASKGAAEVERMSLHKDSYCTISEAKAGLCKLKANGMQGWDSNYAGAFGETTLAAEGELAGYAYAAMVADTRAPAALDCKSAACAAAASEQLALSAVGTMVADAFVGQVLERRVPVITGN
jgi:hypothetical protein